MQPDTIQNTAAEPFNPAGPGTPENLWRLALAKHGAWAPRRGPLLVVSPHPDDEVLGAGGLMRMWSAWQLPVMLLSVTDGEGAESGQRSLKRRRRIELDRTLRVLSPAGISAVRLGLPDGAGVANRSALQQALLTLCEQSAHRPTLIAPYERDGHPDHETVGETCLQMARAFDLPIARYLIWAWHHAHPDDFEGERFGRFALDNSTQAAKADAVDCFTSRTPVIPAHVLIYFRREFEAFLL